MLIDRLNLTTHNPEQREMPIRSRRRCEFPSHRARHLRAPNSFRGVGGWGPGVLVRLQHDSLQLEARGPESLRQMKRKRAAGKDFRLRIPGPGGLRSGKMNFSLQHGSIGIPQTRRTPLGDQFKPVVPASLSNGAERFETFLKEIDQSRRVMFNSLQPHLFAFLRCYSDS